MKHRSPQKPSISFDKVFLCQMLSSLDVPTPRRTDCGTTDYQIHSQQTPYVTGIL